MAGIFQHLLKTGGRQLTARGPYVAGQAKSCGPQPRYKL